MEILEGKKYLITTYGCQMNLHESEKLAGILTSLGMTDCESEQDADIIVFNTCCIRENAEERAEGNIGALKQLKKKKFIKFVNLFSLPKDFHQTRKILQFCLKLKA